MGGEEARKWEEQRESGSCNLDMLYEEKKLSLIKKTKTHTWFYYKNFETSLEMLEMFLINEDWNVLVSTLITH